MISTAVGGVPEVVRDGENGLLVEPGDVEAFGAAVRRYLEDEGLRDRLRANAVASVAEFDRDTVYGRLESILERACAA